MTKDEEASLRAALSAAQGESVDYARHIETLCKDIRYMAGIASKGFNQPWPEHKPATAWVLEYVQHLESQMKIQHGKEKP